MKKYIAIDIGGTKVKHGIILEDSSIFEKSSYKTNCNNYDIFIIDLINIINYYRNNYEISGIGISIPGFVDTSTGFTQRAGAITILDGKNLKTIIENTTNISVSIENDANCVALAEKLNGNAKDCKDFICYTIGTGIGGGIFVNNRIVHGKKFMAGEFGFMKINDNTNDTLHNNSSTSSLISNYKKLKNIPQNQYIEGDIVFQSIQTDILVKELVEKWYKNIASSIFNLGVTLNPEKILIGGAISQRDDLIINIQKELSKFEFWNEFEIVIEPCMHRNDAGMIGSVYNFIKKNYSVSS